MPCYKYLSSTKISSISSFQARKLIVDVYCVYIKSILPEICYSKLLLLSETILSNSFRILEIVMGN